MTTREWLKKNRSKLEKLPRKEVVDAACKATGCGPRNAKKMLQYLGWSYPCASPRNVPSSKPVVAGGKSLSDFRAQYDKSYIVPRKVKEALKVLGASGWEYEVQFAHLAGVSISDLSMFRDQFAAHIVQISKDGRRAWAGSAKTAEEMRKML